MEALQFSTYGRPDVRTVAEVDEPHPGAGQRVRRRLLPYRPGVRHEGITAAVNTAMGAIRLVVAEHENRFEGSGNAVVELLQSLGEEHGHRAVEIAGLFLARAAAAGFENLARSEGDPVEDVLAQYQ